MIFKRKICKYEAEQILRDTEMRRILLELLQDNTKPKNTPCWPDPMIDDEGVITELKRILKIR